MSIDQYFYKEKDSEVFHSSRYAGMLDANIEGLETVSLCDECDNNWGSFNCYGCYPWYKIKISKEDLPKVTANMSSNKTLFEDIMKRMNQDYFWLEER